eukprot:GAHX01004058.1.p2 GENE.GAHX01004058.1~~GAHX01004058.1.p2  ORF type:complete len:81 (+),score=11.20 GAHX01004058.1:154-396(+)
MYDFNYLTEFCPNAGIEGEVMFGNQSNLMKNDDLNSNSEIGRHKKTTWNTIKILSKKLDLVLYFGSELNKKCGENFLRKL